MVLRLLSVLLETSV